MKGSRVRVMCVDGHNLVRECVVAVIEREPGMRVIAEARTVKGAVERYTDTTPDVTLVSLPPCGLDGLEVIRAIRRVDPHARIVVYAKDETEAAYTALDAGAAAFVLESAAPCELVRVMADIHGRHGVPLDVRRKLEARGGMPTLTSREIEILEMLTQGHRIRAISTSLRISDHTVKVYVKSAYSKLGVHGRAAAVAEALRRGFVRLAAERPAPNVAVPEERRIA
jgi:two-component system NarL family response regulator